MGRDLIRALHINIYGSTLSCNEVETDEAKKYKLKTQIFSEFDELFTESEELPNMKGCIHKIKVDSKVSPVSQKLRRLPFEARDKVSAKLIELEKQG